MELKGKTYCVVFLAALVLTVAVSSALREAQAYYQVNGLLADHGIWLEEKAAKGMLLATRKTPPKVVFIGSSRVQFNIDSSLFERAGIPAFNYGVPGLYWEDYPYAVNRAVESGAEVIVISVRPDSFARPVSCPHGAGVEDWIAHIRLRGIFNDCLWQREGLLLPLLFSNRVRKFMGDTDQKATRRNLVLLADIYGVHPDPAAVSHIHGVPGKLLVLFKNGDGLIYANQSTRRPTGEASVPPPTEESLRFLRILTEPAVAAGRPVFILLQPMSFTSRYDRTELIRNLGAGTEVIDASNLVFEESDWADYTHFNARGRERYTRHLLTIIGPVVQGGKG